MRAKSNRVREGNGGRFQGRRKGKENSFCFVIVSCVGDEDELLTKVNTLSLSLLIVLFDTEFI